MFTKNISVFLGDTGVIRYSSCSFQEIQQKQRSLDKQSKYGKMVLIVGFK